MDLGRLGSESGKSEGHGWNQDMWLLYSLPSRIGELCFASSWYQKAKEPLNGSWLGRIRLSLHQYINMEFMGVSFELYNNIILKIHCHQTNNSTSKYRDITVTVIIRSKSNTLPISKSSAPSAAASSTTVRAAWSSPLATKFWKSGAWERIASRFIPKSGTSKIRGFSFLIKLVFSNTPFLNPAVLKWL